MGLRFYFGASGAGKSTGLQKEIIKRSMEEPGTHFFVIVPDQFTMQTDSQTPRFTGNKYYTPTYGTEGFYTPWGISPLDIGQEYFETGIGAVSLVGVLLFAIPFGIGFLRQIVAKFQDSLK